MHNSGVTAQLGANPGFPANAVASSAGLVHIAWPDPHGVQLGRPVRCCAALCGPGPGCRVYSSGAVECVVTRPMRVHGVEVPAAALDSVRFLIEQAGHPFTTASVAEVLMGRDMPGHVSSGPRVGQPVAIRTVHHILRAGAMLEFG